MERPRASPMVGRPALERPRPPLTLATHAPRTAQRAGAAMRAQEKPGTRLTAVVRAAMWPRAAAHHHRRRGRWLFRLWAAAAAWPRAQCSKR
eukprot:2717600-Alexandrium_andersonii.AAC.1